MSNRSRCKRLSTIIYLAGYLFLPGVPGFPTVNASASGDGMHLYIPEKVNAGKEIPVRVVFDHRPPVKEFWRLVVDMDGNPVALADLSLGKETVVNVPSPAPGVHKMAVLWKNPPGGKPLLIQRSVIIMRDLPGKSAGTPDQKLPH